MAIVNPSGEYQFWPRRDLTHPQNGVYFQAVRDAWWVRNVYDELCVFVAPSGRVYPVCNVSHDIAERLADSIPTARGTVQIPLAFVPIRLEDYR